MQQNIFAKRGFIFLDIHKIQGRSSSNSAINYKKYLAGKYTRVRTPLARKHTNQMFESKDSTTRMKLVNQSERHNFCLNDLLTKSNRTEIQTYDVEEHTFGTPCSLFIFEVLQYGKCVFLFHADVFIDVSLMSQICKVSIFALWYCL